MNTKIQYHVSYTLFRIQLDIVWVIFMKLK